MFVAALSLALSIASAPLQPSLQQVADASLSVDERIAAEAAAIHDAVSQWRERQERMRLLPAEDGRFRLVTDFSKREAERMLDSAEEILGRLDLALGFPEPEAVPGPVTLVLLQDPDRYRDLCATLGAAAPRLADYFRSVADSTGFTSFAPPISVVHTGHQRQVEARPEHSLGHALVHLELHRRYGILPLWLREGLALAGEDSTWGEVWAPWFLDGFVFSSSHADWRGRETRKLVAGLEGDWSRVFGWEGRPYDPERSRLAYAFSTWALEAEPEGLARFLELLRVEYAKDADGGEALFGAERTRELAVEAFGEDFAERLAAWWKHPRSWKKWKKEWKLARSEDLAARD